MKYLIVGLGLVAAASVAAFGEVPVQAKPNFVAADRVTLNTNIDWEAYKKALSKAQKATGTKPFVSDKAVKIWLADAIEKNGGLDKVKPEDIDKIWKMYVTGAKEQARCN